MYKLALSVLLISSLICVSLAKFKSIRYDAKTHTAIKSSGCGKASPYTPGQSVTATGTYAGVTWTYRIYVPKGYDKDIPIPIIFQHPGWGMSAKSEEAGAGITSYADAKNYISVTPQGLGDNKHRGGPWYSWNAAGTTQSPGPGGAICTSKANYPSYCYDSCKCTDKPQCMWTTCEETVTPTGTGRSNIGGFIPSLYDTLESQLCIDTTREYAAGESNGGIMTYQLGVDISQRLAAIAPQFGSFHKGWNLNPEHGLPVIDLHGSKDTTVPGNVSLSGDGYYYTTTDDIFGGNSFSAGWMKSNDCTGSASHYPTKWDGQSKFWCVSVGSCSGGDVVRCSWNGGHNWLFNSASANGDFVSTFLLQWTKVTHIGMGSVAGETRADGDILQNVTILSAQEERDLERADEEMLLKDDNLHMTESNDTKHRRSHYGNPRHGCNSDEDVISAGSGKVCAFRVKSTKTGEKGLPNPQCKLGEARVKNSGCPTDFRGAKGKRAWPLCLAKGSSDPYNDGSFYCLLSCPCLGKGNDCGPKSHAQCPGKSKCERGELRHRAYGVCTYH